VEKSTLHQQEGAGAGEMEDIWLHMYTCFAQCGVSHHSQLNAAGVFIQRSSLFSSSIPHLFTCSCSYPISLSGVAGLAREPLGQMVD